MLLAAGPSHAREVVEFQVLNGTGFFVSIRGYAITNAHVVRGCKEVVVRGPVPPTRAKVVDTDEQYDLALLKIDAPVPKIATIRQPKATSIRQGEPVLVMGFPLANKTPGEYSIAESTVIGTRGPQDEPHWIQFADAAQQGNSGGPLLDGSGNVAGVIVAKTELRRIDEANGTNELVSQSDIAISLPILMKFLDRNHVVYRTNGSFTHQMSRRVEQQAKTYILNVLCPVGVPVEAILPR